MRSSLTLVLSVSVLPAVATGWLHRPGEQSFDCRPNGRKISWLQDPGTYDSGEICRQRLIDDLVATHRVTLSHFTPTGQFELLALPVVGPRGPGRRRQTHRANVVP